MEKIISWLTVFGSMAALLLKFSQTAKLFGWMPIDYGIAIDSSELVLGKTAQIKLVALWKDGSKPDLEGYQCEWIFSPPLGNPPSQGERAVEVTDSPELFRSDGPGVITRQIGVMATSPSGSVAKIQPSAPNTILMHNISAPIVNEALATLELGQESRSRLSFEIA